MSINVEDIKKLVEEEGEYLITLRRHFHKNAELSLKEFETAKKIEEELSSFGLGTRRVGETGVYAEIKGRGKGKTLILRSDIDALPIYEKHECEYKSVNDGVMHACGHDAHTAALLTAAKILSKNKEEFPGTIKLCFQQAEEIGQGARVFLKEGLIKGDRTFGLHVASHIPVGKIAAVPGPTNASVDFFKITVKGKNAHVSAPQEGVDSIYIASQIVTSLQAIVARLISPIDSVIIGVGKFNAGTGYNVVAPSAVLEGTIRALNRDTRERVKKLLAKLVKNTALTFNGEATIEYEDYASPLVNDKESTEEVIKVASLVVGEKNVITDKKPSLGGDDFAEFNKAVPGTYCFVGSANKKIAETTVAHHNEYFDIDERALFTAAALHTAYSLYYLNSIL